MKNSIFSIRPYNYRGGWVFDDERVNLVKEPFIMGIPDMIERILLLKPEFNNGFTVLFSSTGIPEPDIILHKQEEEFDGNWYICEETKMRGWLCPALNLYYKEAPQKLYIKFIAQ